MRFFKHSIGFFIPILAIILGACTLPSTYAPTHQPTTESGNPEYTAAAATIAAQLTEISIPIEPLPTSEGARTDTPEPAAPSPSQPPANAEDIPTETLPPTSSAFPTNTPLPSDTPIPTETPTPTNTSPPTDTPTPTLVVDDPKIVMELGEPSWQDTFENTSNWPLYNDEHVSMNLTSNNELQMTAKNADKWESWMLTWPVLTNFYLEVVVTPLDCNGLDRYGLLARASADAKGGYLFGLTCDGRYSFRTWDGEGFNMLSAWTPSPLVLKGPGQTNRLGLLAEENRFTLYNNGHLLTTIVDEAESFTEGLVGLFVGSVLTPNMTVQFTEVSIWELP